MVIYFFRTAIEPNNNVQEDNSMLSIYMTQNLDEKVIIVRMSEFNLILAIDYLLSLLEILTKSFVFKEFSDVTQLETSKSMNPSLLSMNVSSIGPNAVTKVQKSSSRIITDISFHKMEVVMLESIDIINSEALVFDCSTQIHLRIEDDAIMINGSISNITMAFTNYLNYKNSKELEAYVMAPTELIINGSIKDSTQNLDFTFSEIYITITPSMVNKILNILTAIGRSPKEEKSEKIDLTKLDKLLEPRRIDPKICCLNQATQAKEALSLLNEIDESKQSKIIFNMNQVKILIKSGGIESHPLINISLQTCSKFINKKKLEIECSIYSDYYNHSLSSWEPLIEIVDNKMSILRCLITLEEATKIDVEMENLELLLTKSSVNILYDVHNAFTRVIQRKKDSEISELNRVIIKNYLGIDLDLFLNKCNVYLPDEKMAGGGGGAGTGKSTSAKKLTIQSGSQQQFCCKDLNNVLLHVNLIISRAVLIERTIVCGQKSLRCYSLSVKTYPVNENWSFLVQVAENETGKEIIFRSNTQIINNFNNSFELFSFMDGNYHYLTKIEPHSTFFLPLSAVYGLIKFIFNSNFNLINLFR